MPDISMCANQNCESRVHCYRYRAIPSEFRQSYLVNDEPVIRCDHYWSTSGMDDSQLVPFKQVTNPFETPTKHEDGKDE